MLDCGGHVVHVGFPAPKSSRRVKPIRSQIRLARIPGGKPPLELAASIAERVRHHVPDLMENNEVERIIGGFVGNELRAIDLGDPSAVPIRMNRTGAARYTYIIRTGRGHVIMIEDIDEIGKIECLVAGRSLERHREVAATSIQKIMEFRRQILPVRFGDGFRIGCRGRRILRRRETRLSRSPTPTMRSP